METAAGCLEIANDVAVVGQNVTAILGAGVNLQAVIVPVEVGSRDLNPLTVQLPECSFVSKPYVVVMQKFFDLGYNVHEIENSPICILDGPVMLQCCMNASQVETRSNVLVYRSLGAKTAHLSKSL